MLNRCRAFKVLPRVRIPPSPNPRFPPCGNIHILAILLALLVPVDGWHGAASQDVTLEADLRELVRLVTELQKNPWEGWPAGTRVVVRYLIERNSKGKALGREQPGIVFTVVDLSSPTPEDCGAE